MKISCDLDSCYNADTEKDDLMSFYYNLDVKDMVVNSLESSGLTAMRDGSYQQNKDNLSTTVPNHCNMVFK